MARRTRQGVGRVDAVAIETRLHGRLDGPVVDVSLDRVTRSAPHRVRCQVVFSVVEDQGRRTVSGLYRVDVGTETFSALDDEARRAIFERITAEKKKGKVMETRFKGLGEMNPLQLRESTVDPDTRRLVQLTVESAPATTRMMDMLLGKKRASDRKAWLEDKGNLATV